MDKLQQSYQALRQQIAPLQRVIVAFSAGIDSTVVLKVALDELGRDNVLAATGVSPSLAQKELTSVRELANLLGAELHLLETREMENADYVANSERRCYFCKSELYGRLTELAQQQGFNAIVCGINADDTGDWRPGMQAAEQFQVRAPLLAAGFSKADVRALARHLGLPNWEKPALACLASRIPYGTAVTLQSLQQVESAEAFLYEQGFRVLRVRHHGKVARIEVPEAELGRLMSEPLRGQIVARFKELGYTYVTADLQGFRSGSGNEVLSRA